MDVRPARQDDLAHLPRVELSAATSFRGHDVPDSVFSDFTPPEAYRPNLAAGTLWVADGVDGVCAFLLATAHRDRLHIDEFAVAREAQGHGLGRRMLGLVIDWARANDFTCVSLTTFRSVPFNAPFYASMGFVDWPADEAAPPVRQALANEAAKGLKDRCAMILRL